VNSFGALPPNRFARCPSQTVGYVNRCRQAMMCKIGKLAFVAGAELPRRYLI